MKLVFLALLASTLAWSQPSLLECAGRLARGDRHLQRATVVWGPPVTGTDAVRYVILIEYHGDLSDTTLGVPIFAWTDSLRFRVAGVDSLDRIGLWSDWTDWKCED